MLKKLFIALGLIVAIGLFLYQNNMNSWRMIYKKDLKAIYEILKENHPGFYDDQNPEFKAWLISGYAQALHKADQITSSVGYLDGLQFFVNGFKDNHLRLIYDPVVFGSDDLSKAPKGEVLLASVKELGPQQVWVTIPSFYPQSTEEEDALKNIISLMPKYKDNKFIIFDVRGNKGGNSHYGTQILENLYGEQYCNACFKRLRAKQYVEWRASQGNIGYLKELLITLEKRFGKGDVVTEFSVIISEMEKNLIVDNPFYRSLNNSVETAEVPISENHLNARVVVITDSYCASACLDFLDELFVLGPVLQVGLPTNVDTNYLECRDVVLPSSLATLHFPIKVFRNRSRKSNQAHTPQVYVEDIYNDEELKRIIFSSVGLE